MLPEAEVLNKPWGTNMGMCHKVNKNLYMRTRNWKLKNHWSYINIHPMGCRILNHIQCWVPLLWDWWNNWVETTQRCFGLSRVYAMQFRSHLVQLVLEAWNGNFLLWFKYQWRNVYNTDYSRDISGQLIPILYIQTGERLRRGNWDYGYIPSASHHEVGMTALVPWILSLPTTILSSYLRGYWMSVTSNLE